MFWLRLMSNDFQRIFSDNMAELSAGQYQRSLSICWFIKTIQWGFNEHIFCHYCCIQNLFTVHSDIKKICKNLKIIFFAIVVEFFICLFQGFCLSVILQKIYFLSLWVHFCSSILNWLLNLSRYCSADILKHW